MLAAGATERDQIEVTGVDALLDGHLADRRGHRRVDDAVDAFGGLDRAGADLCRDRLDHRLSLGAVEHEAAAEQVVGVENPEQQVGVRYRAMGAALAVAGGARYRAGAVRADPDRAALVDPHDAAAAGANRLDVDRGGADRDAPLDLERAGELRRAVADYADVEAGAAHVDRDEVVEADRATEHEAREYAARRTGQAQFDRSAPRLGCAHDAALGAHVLGA